MRRSCCHLSSAGKATAGAAASAAAIAIGACARTAAALPGEGPAFCSTQCHDPHDHRETLMLAKSGTHAEFSVPFHHAMHHCAGATHVCLVQRTRTLEAEGTPHQYARLRKRSISTSTSLEQVLSRLPSGLFSARASSPGMTCACGRLPCSEQRQLSVGHDLLPAATLTTLHLRWPGSVCSSCMASSKAEIGWILQEGL